MDEGNRAAGQNKKILVFLIVLILAIGTAIGFTYYFGFSSEGNTNGSTEPVLTTTYSSLSPLETYDLINSSEQFIVIDVRSRCPCNWDTEHVGLNNTFRALKRTDLDYSEFYNETSDIIIYDDGGTTAIEWCEGLVNHTYGKICYIEGGFPSWRDVYHLPTISPD